MSANNTQHKALVDPSYAPIIVINFITVAFYVIIFFVPVFNSQAKTGLVPLNINLSLILLLIIVTISSIRSGSKDISPSSLTKYTKSSILILLLALCNTANGSILLFLNGFANYRAALVQLANILNIWVVYYIPAAYFPEYYNDIKEGINGVNSSRGIIPADGAEREGEQEEEEGDRLLRTSTDTTIVSKKPKRLGLSCVVIYSLLCFITGFIVFWLKNPEDWDKGWINVILDFALLGQELARVLFIYLQVLRVQNIAYKGMFFSDSHSHGFSFLLIFGGFFVMGGLNILSLIMGVPHSIYLDFLNSPVLFYICGISALCNLFPLLFHIYNIRQEWVFKRTTTGEVCDSGARMKWILYIYILEIHISSVGYVHETYTSSSSLPLAPPLVASLVATCDLCFVAVSFLSPVWQLFTQFVNFGVFDSSKKNEFGFHRNMGLSVIFFAVIHMVYHIVNWHKSLQLPPSHHNDTFAFLLPDTTSSSSSSDGSSHIPNYGANFVTFTGIFALVGFLVAGITGFLFRNISSPSIFASLHVPLASVGFFAFFVHAKTSQAPLSDYFVIFAFSLAVLCYALFHIFFRTQSLAIAQRIPQNDEITSESSSQRAKNRNNNPECLFLVLKYANSNVIPPGSFFLIYAGTNTNLDLFYARPFPVFSSQNRSVSFLIRCSESFALSLRQNTTVRVQGPFQGPARFFIQRLAKLVENSNVFLCGWTAGMGTIFSLLEHLQQNLMVYNKVKAINCMFGKINEDEIRNEINAYVTRFAQNWETNVPIYIIGSAVARLENVSIMAENFKTFPTAKEAEDHWKNIFPGVEVWAILPKARTDFEIESRQANAPNRRKAVLYYCGKNFQRHLFPVSEWRTYVESC